VQRPKQVFNMFLILSTSSALSCEIRKTYIISLQLNNNVRNVTNSFNAVIHQQEQYINITIQGVWVRRSTSTTNFAFLWRLSVSNLTAYIKQNKCTHGLECKKISLSAQDRRVLTLRIPSNSVHSFLSYLLIHGHICTQRHIPTHSINCIFHSWG